jgi:ribonuclease Z
VNNKFLVVFMGGVVSAFLFISLMGAGGVVESPTGVAPDRYVYYPGTEALAADEIRLIACGTGLPAASRDQQATCWLADRKTV